MDIIDKAAWSPFHLLYPFLAEGEEVGFLWIPSLHLRSGVADSLGLFKTPSYIRDNNQCSLLEGPSPACERPGHV